MSDQQRTALAYSPSSEGEDIEIWGPYLFNPQQKTATLLGRDIPLIDEEFALALLLFRNLSLALSYDIIVRTVWRDGADISDRVLQAHIAKIRIRLRLNTENGLRLASVYRFGYRLERLDAWDGSQPRGVGGSWARPKITERNGVIC